jgi:hypothetical protein
VIPLTRMLITTIKKTPDSSRDFNLTLKLLGLMPVLLVKVENKSKCKSICLWFL